MSTRLLAAVCAMAAVTLVAPATGQDSSATEDKLRALTEPSAGRVTTLTESELNAWLAIEAVESLPEGVTNPSLRLLGEGRVTGQATVDLGTLRSEQKGGGVDPLRFLSGSVPVVLTGTLFSGEGIGRFDLEHVSIGGLPLPPTLVADAISRYSRSPERPEGLRVNEPFDLPGAVGRIEIAVGRAIVFE